MPPDICHFTVPQKTTAAEVFAQLESLGKVRTEAAGNLLRTYFDTFDWRLWHHGSLLVEERSPNRNDVCWRYLADGRIIGQLPGAVPRFREGFPDSPLGHGIGPIIDIRALLPVAVTQVARHRGKLLNRDDKIVLRIVIEEAIAGEDAETIRFPVPLRIRLEPLKGYSKPFRKAQSLLEEILALPAAASELETVLEAIGQKAAGYSSRLNLKLGSAMTAGAAVRIIFGRLLETMERNCDGARADIDPEFLHDFRVAVRRTRSLFSQTKGVLPEEAVQRFRPEFKWLGEITGPTRDFDVYLLTFPAYRACLDEAMRPDLEPLLDFLAERQRTAHKKLARQLGSLRCQLLFREWREFLEAPPAKWTWPLKADLPIGGIASRRIWKACRLTWQEGMLVTPCSPPETFHEMRILCKKLRYLLEFFQTLYPPKEIRELIKILKELQDNLGAHQDLTVQIRALQLFAAEMQQERKMPPGAAFIAMGALIDHLKQRRLALGAAFPPLFDRFAEKESRRLCKSLFADKNRPEEVE
ncbi:MAG: CHAD domain-containing protein [Deltaproteobacteria bacterium]|nr:CHAD domain-containing protein [Deltaproteobacteria bacterium]